MAALALAADKMETWPLGNRHDVDKQKVPRPRNGPAIWAGGEKVLYLAHLRVGSVPGAWIRVVVFV